MQIPRESTSSEAGIRGELRAGSSQHDDGAREPCRARSRARVTRITVTCARFQHPHPRWRPHRPAAVKPLRGCSAPLRPFAGRMLRIRLEVTAPFRCGSFASMLFAERSRPEGPVHAATSMEAKGLGRAEGSMFASVSEQPAVAGVTLTPSTGQAVRTEVIGPALFWRRVFTGPKRVLTRSRRPLAGCDPSAAWALSRTSGGHLGDRSSR